MLENPMQRRSFLTGALAIAAIGANALWPAPALAAPDASSLVRAAYDNWRSKTSETTVSMTIHRPSWERKLTMKGYSRGQGDALVRFTSPPKDAGNATLKLGNKTWVYNPKLNQVVKLPASLLGQPWMGSDFSYSDLARSDDVLKYYRHKIIGQARSGGHVIYEIEALPKPGAPVVWGKQVLKIRDDGVLMAVTFFDQDMRPVRMMTTDKVRKMGGRNYPAVLTMRKAGTNNQWTRLETRQAEFDKPLPNYLFTKSNLSNPRD